MDALFGRRTSVLDALEQRREPLIRRTFAACVDVPRCSMTTFSRLRRNNVSTSTQTGCAHTTSAASHSPNDCNVKILKIISRAHPSEVLGRLR